MRAPTIDQIILYTKRIDQMVEFYCHHFGFAPLRRENDRLIELNHSQHDFKLLLHPMGQGRKEGQVLMKILFDVEDVQPFCEKAKETGLEFGPIHQADGYQFANAKDPSGNSISISSRAFRKSI